MQEYEGTRDRTGTAKVTRARRWAGALLLGGTLAVLAAAIVGLSISASSRPPASIAREPLELHPQGDFTHMSGFLMPEKAGPFERVAVTQYDEAGQNLSAGYDALVGDATPLPIVATLYVHPAPASDDLDACFDRLLREIGEYHGGAEPQFRKNILLSPRQFVGRYAVFAYEEPWGGVTENVPLRSYLVVYRWRTWWVKWRVTTPAPINDERMKAIVNLTESLLPPEVEPEQAAPSPPSSSFQKMLMW
jgi:hypothetical protein